MKPENQTSTCVFHRLSWQTYDVEYHAATFDTAGKKTADAWLTVKHNGVLIHEKVKLPRATRAAPLAEGPEDGPIFLQNHGGDPLRYRNIWVKPIAGITDPTTARREGTPASRDPQRSMNSGRYSDFTEGAAFRSGTLPVGHMTFQAMTAKRDRPHDRDYQSGEFRTDLMAVLLCCLYR